MSKYFPIRVSTLRGDQKISFNAYVQVAGKFILLCREGDSFEGGRLDRLKGKKLQKMYISEDYVKAYDNYIRQNIEQAYDKSKDKPIDMRVQIIHGALQACAEDLMEDPVNTDFYNVAIDGARKFCKFFFSEPKALKPILEIKNSDFNVAHHGVVVSALALAVAEEMKFTESRPMQLETLSVGCMIHDLEHNYNNINLTVTPDKLTRAEKAIYDRHAQDGYERLRKEKIYDSLVLDVVRLHNEKIDGSGECGIKEKDLDPLIAIVSAVNEFDHFITYDNLTPKDALKKILIDKMGILNLDIMRSLQAVLKKREII